jgi:hypothetical protein
MGVAVRWGKMAAGLKRRPVTICSRSSNTATPEVAESQIRFVTATTDRGISGSPTADGESSPRLPARPVGW